MKKEKKTLEQHAWPQQLKHVLTSEEEEILLYEEHGPKGYAEVLQRLNAGEYLPIPIIFQPQSMSIRDTRSIQSYVTSLNRLGLDIGKGDSEYGFKMPLPENGRNYRELVIFRRWKD